jgi:peptidoglycan/LPS O-acetylase OafA/YrhL
MQASRRIRLLDSLRGLAALVVLLHHACTLFPRSLGVNAQQTASVFVVLQALSRLNTEAVLLFFVLSGFSIRLSIAPHGLDQPRDLLRYAERRLLRILPLYWFALALSGTIAVWLAPVPAQASAPYTLLGNLLFLQTAVGVDGAWFLPYAGNGALWSLSFEMFYYAAFPLLVRAVSGKRTRLGLVLAATALGQLVGSVWPCPFTMFLGASLIWYVGVLLAERYLSGSATLPWWAAAALAALLGLTQLGARSVQFYGLWLGSLLLLAGSALIQHAPRLRVLSRPLDRPLLSPLARAGDISYALYLLHLPVLRAALALIGDRWLAVAIGLASSLTLAYGAERAALSLTRSRVREQESVELAPAA